MHNPDTSGFLRFSHGDEGAKECRNVEWPVRYFLAQIYQAQIQYVLRNGAYALSLHELLSSYVDEAHNTKVPYCSLENGCYPSKLKIIEDNPADLHLMLTVHNQATDCVRYSQERSSTSGGPCFTATLSYTDALR